MGDAFAYLCGYLSPRRHPDRRRQGKPARDRRQSEPPRAHVVLEGRLMAQRPQRPQRPKPVPMPPPVAHEIPCTCDACLVLDAVRFVEEKRRVSGPRVIRDFNPHDGALAPAVVTGVNRTHFGGK